MYSIRLLTALTFITIAIADCFFPNGGVAGSDTACNPNALVSHCCFDNQACLSNGLCVSDPHDAEKARFHRGTCTDQGWKSGNCPRFCLDIDNNGAPVYGCNQTNVDSYCCGNNCVCTEFLGFTLADSPDAVSTVTIIGESFTQSRTATPSAASSAASSRATSDASAASSATSSGTASTGAPSAAASIASGSAQIATATSQPAEEGNKSSSNSVAIGVGVGVGVAAAILIGGAGLFIFWRRKSQAERLPGAAYNPPRELESRGYTGPVKYTHNGAINQTPGELYTEEVAYELAAHPDRNSRGYHFPK